MPASRFHVAAHDERTPTLFDDAVCDPDAARPALRSFEPSGLDSPTRICCNKASHFRTRLAEIALLYARSEEISLSGRTSVEDAELLVREAVRLDGSLAPKTREKVIRGVATFFRTVRAWGLVYMDEVDADLVLGFVTAGTARRGEIRASASSTQRNRLWFVRSIVDILYDHECWDGRDLVSDGIRSSIEEPSRPLSNEEMEAVRDVSYHWLIPTRRPLIVALSEAGGSPTEIALVESSDIDLEAGTVKFGRPVVRANQLAPGVLEVIKRVIADGYPFDGRLVAGSNLSPERATQSVSTELSRVIREAGLRNEPGAVGKSIRLHTAEMILMREGLFAAARFLGADSLDRVAASLRFDWRASE